jgi:murein L,D-transpeptidase YafK
MRWIFLVLVLASQLASADQLKATRIVVDKSDRQLLVYSGWELVKTYSIGLGLSPIGPKRAAGDRKTPEGKYLLDFKNAGSSYYKSIRISYPDEQDRTRAKQLGVEPGGDVMIHGYPIDAATRKRLIARRSLDWTDGCISLSNEDMDSLWSLIEVPLPIEIKP